MLRIKKMVLVTLLVTFAMFSAQGCGNKKVDTNPGQPVEQISKGDQFIRDVKRYGPAIVTALEEGIKQEALLAKEGVDEQGNRIPATINADLHKRLERWLQGGQKTAKNFVERAAKWTHFDVNNKDDIAKFLDEAFAFVEQVYNDGILQIKNAWSQQIASGILSGAKITLTLFKSQFQEVQQ